MKYIITQPPNIAGIGHQFHNWCLGLVVSEMLGCEYLYTPINSKIRNGKSLDDKFSLKPILILSKEINNNISSKLNSIQSKNNKDLEKFFKSSNSKAVIVRPDRFILSSCKSVKKFKSYLKKNLSILV